MIMDGMLSIRLLCSTEHELTQSADLKLEIQNSVVPGMIMTGRIKIHLSHQDSSFSVFPFLLRSQAVSSLFSLKSHMNNLIENTQGIFLCCHSFPILTDFGLVWFGFVTVGEANCGRYLTGQIFIANR